MGSSDRQGCPSINLGGLETSGEEELTGDALRAGHPQFSAVSRPGKGPSLARIRLGPGLEAIRRPMGRDAEGF